jgi:nitroreductase
MIPSYIKTVVLKWLPEGLSDQLQRMRRPYVRGKLRRIERRRLAECYRYDIERFWKNSPGAHLTFATPDEVGISETQLASMMAINYHAIEKGLSHPNPRPGFGRAKVRNLCEQVEQFLNRFGCKDIVSVSVNALSAYADHASGEDNLDPSLKNWIQSIKRKHACLQEVGNNATLGVTRAGIHASGKRDLTEFFASRYSIRNFSKKPVAKEDVENAVVMAAKSPSVCNRQSAKCYLIEGPENLSSVLALQNGNRGFGHTADKVLIVTSDTQCFPAFEERNQCWIDGGLFAMSLVYALHSIGLGTCCLNWSATNENDIALKRLTGIPENEAIIMMIAIGHIPDHLKVARSARKAVQELLLKVERVNQPAAC